ncbi:hypothetical protein F1641_07050 [Quadrisphaera sp. INWT6]|nr:hypothetical protein [Quadrisphaera sp. INWT6]
MPAALPALERRGGRLGPVVTVQAAGPTGQCAPQVLGERVGVAGAELARLLGQVLVDILAPLLEHALRHAREQLHGDVDVGP